MTAGVPISPREQFREACMHFLASVGQWHGTTHPYYAEAFALLRKVLPDEDGKIFGMEIVQSSVLPPGALVMAPQKVCPGFGDSVVIAYSTPTAPTDHSRDTFLANPAQFGSYAGELKSSRDREKWLYGDWSEEDDKPRREPAKCTGGCGATLLYGKPMCINCQRKAQDDTPPNTDDKDNMTP